MWVPIFWFRSGDLAGRPVEPGPRAYLLGELLHVRLRREALELRHVLLSLRALVGWGGGWSGARLVPVGGWHPRRRRGGTGVGVYRGPTVDSAVCHGDVPSPPGRDLRPGTRHRRRRSRWARRPPRSPRQAGGPFPGLIPHSRAPASPPWRFRDGRCVHRRSRRSRTWSGVCACRTPSPSATGAASCGARTAVFFKVKLPARPSRLAGTIAVVTRRSLLSAIDRTREGCLPLSAGSRPRSHAPPPRCTKGESPVASRTSARAVAAPNASFRR